MGKGFRIDALGIKAGILKTVAPSISAAQGSQSFIDQTNTVFDDAMAADRFDAANTAIHAAFVAANALHDRNWRDRMESRLERLKLLQVQFGKLADMRSRLAKNPADPDANTLVGKYCCFDKGDWKVGLPMLAIGSEKAPQTLAVTELSRPSDTSEVMKLANGWWNLSQNLATTRRLRVMRHSSAIYSRFVSNLQGPQLAEARKRIETTELATARPINLMPMIDVAQDGVRGHWKMQSNGLLAYGENGWDDSFRELRIRCQVPDEYDFRISFLAADKRNYVRMLLSHAGHVFAWDMGQTTFTNYISYYGIETVGNRDPNSSSANGPILDAGSSHSAVVKVRKNSIACYLDGTQLSEVKTDFANVNMMKGLHNPAQSIGNGLGLGGACYNAMGSTLFTKLELVEIASEDSEQ